MRGKDFFFFAVKETERITPAHAGKSFVEKVVPPIKEDHPRTCGEKKTGLSNEEMIKGSPPHMRGKGDNFVISDSECRDHPRTCGEKSIQKFRNASDLGSPPHMRGKVLCRIWL